MTSPWIAVDIEVQIAALAPLLRLGIRVLPVWGIAPGGFCRCRMGRMCESPGKHPCEKGWQDSASTDPVRLREWALLYPGGNWGVVTGTALPDGRYWAVIDVDVKNNGLEDWAEIVRNEMGLEPVTPTVSTGGGGWHFYVATRSPTPTGKLAKGIDFKATGGFVVLPCSRHRTERLYAWTLAPSIPIADVEPSIVDRLQNWRLPKVPALPALGDIPDGQRTNTMLSFAGTLLRAGLDELATRAALSSLNERRCAPPMSAAVLGDLVASIDRLENQRRNKEGEEPRLVGELLAEGVPESAILLAPYGVTTGRPTLLSGPSGSGKTTLAQDLAINVAAGTGTCWADVELRLSGGVIHVDYEQGRRETLHRYERIARGLGVELKRLPLSLVAPRIYLDGRGARPFFLRLMRGRSLLIIDNLRAACPRMKENESESRRALDLLRELSEETGCLVLVLLHEGKPQSGVAGAPLARSPRGSSALVDAAGVVISLGGTGKGRRTLRHIKAPVSEPASPRHLFLVSGDMQSTGYPLSVKLTVGAASSESVDGRPPVPTGELHRKILQQVAATPGKNMTELADSLKGESGPRRAALKALHERGLLTFAGGPNGARLVHLTPEGQKALQCAETF